MPIKHYIILIILLAVIAVIPILIHNNYYIGVFIFTSFNCLACIGLSLLMGYAGQISIGHAAFIAIGAYASGILTVKIGWSPWTAMAAGVGLSAAVAIIIGVPSLRLKGHYLAMATLGFATIIHVISVAAVWLTGGPEGINGIPKLNLMGLVLDTDKKFFYFSWGVVALGLYFALNLIHSRMGRALCAIHGSEDAAASIGINTSQCKIQIFVISAIYASLSGSLYACYVSYIDPGPFGIMHSVLLVTMVAVGGIHRLWGAIIGAVLLSLLPEFLSFASEYFQRFGITYKQDYDVLIYGGILLSIMLFLPEGLIEGVDKCLKCVAKV